MSDTLTQKQIKTLKGIAQRLDFEVRLGKAGLTDAFIKGLDETLAKRELVKVRFSDHKDERKELSLEIAEKTGAQLITRVGHVSVFYRKNPDAKEPILK